MADFIYFSRKLALSIVGSQSLMWVYMCLAFTLAILAGSQVFSGSKAKRLAFLAIVIFGISQGFAAMYMMM